MVCVSFISSCELVFVPPRLVGSPLVPPASLVFTVLIEGLHWERRALRVPTVPQALQSPPPVHEEHLATQRDSSM